jgi:energy-coupling factor transporter ATP-binding protein EcfA2
MGLSKNQERPAKTKALKVPTRGRSGGRAGGSGYDFQDVFVAWQLAKMLMDDHDPIVEVLWEKKAIDTGAGRCPEPAYIDDAIVRLRSGKWIYTQIKETAPSGGWIVRNLIQSGVVDQLWQQWRVKRPEDRKKTVLQLASGGNVTPLAMINDVALRSRTPNELTSEEAQASVVSGIEEISQYLAISKDDPALLEFLRAVHAVPLPQAADLYGWIIHTLSVFGRDAGSLADRLVRIVAESKHIGPNARSAHTRESLLNQLLEGGVSPDVLAAAGMIVTSNKPDLAFWREYRVELVKSLRTFRVYGLDVEKPVFADLPSLFVPVKLLPIDDPAKEKVEPQSTRRSLIDSLDENTADRSDSRAFSDSATELSVVIAETRRFVLVGTQGCGKTTALRWLAIISALEGEEGTRIRQSCGLSTEPLTPVFIRFRRVAERINALKRHGIRGRVGFIADFLAAEFQAGFGRYIFNEHQSLRVACDLLESKNTILLFDALDEVADESIRNQLLQSVADLMEKYPEPRVVLSSRPYALRKEDLKVGLPRFSTLPLGNKETDIFCDHWYRAVSMHVPRTLNENDASERAARLAQEVRRVPDLAQSPLLLSILALVHFNQGGSLPVERGKLYDFATMAMLGHWERDPARNPGDEGIPDWTETLGLKDSDIRCIVERMARDVQMSETGSEFSVDEAANSLKLGMASLSNRALFTDENTLLLLRLLEDRAGIVQERTTGVYGFVHLGFQEYLAARWFVTHWDDGLVELAKYADKERHAEVIRFVAGILVSDQAWRNEEKARSFILSIADRNAVLAGACILEAPCLEICAEVCEELARAVWSEGWRHFHHRTDIMARLVWVLLDRTSKADRLLLELLGQVDPSHHHFKMEGSEATFPLLALRPSRPLTPELRWFLQRLSVVDDQYGPSVAPICELLLVETGTEPAGDHLDGLIALLHPRSRMFESRTGRNILTARAGDILREQLVGPETAQHALAKLYDVLLTTPSSRNAKGAALFLLSIGEPLTAEFADALVEYSVENRWDSDFRSWIVSIASEPETRSVIIPRLMSALTHEKEKYRECATEMLEELGVTANPLPTSQRDQLHSDSSEKSGEGVVSTKEGVLANLSNDLWLDAENESGRMWSAATAFLAAGQTDVHGIPRALVRAGLVSNSRRKVAIQYLRQLRTHPKQSMAVQASLLDALDSKNDTIAAAAAGVIVDTGNMIGNGNVKRIVRAILRDATQISDTLPQIRLLLHGEWKEKTIEAISKYFDADEDEFDAEVAGFMARLLAEEGHLDAPHLATGLVLGGLSEPDLHEDVLPYITKMLDDPALITDAREKLSEALKSSNENLAWGAVRCLWNAGMRFEPGVISAISNEGLESENEARVQEASGMLKVLIEEPFTAPSTIAVLHERISSLLRWGKEYKKAWPAVQCLIQAGIFNHDKLPEVLVYGGLSDSSKLDQVLEMSKNGVTENKQFAEAVEKVLWAATSQEKIHWEAVAMLNALFRTSLDAALEADSGRRQSIIRVLVGKAEEDSTADSILADISKSWAGTRYIQETLVRLLQDKDDTIAFAAARRLVDRGDLIHMMLPRAVIRGGFGKATKSGKAQHLLDKIRSELAMSLPLHAALNEALWAKDTQIMWNAAIYLVEQCGSTNPVIAHALLRGGLCHNWEAPRANARKRLRAMLIEPSTKIAAEEALISNLFILDEGNRFNFEVASLLAGTGFDMSEALALTFDEHMRWFAAPVLALVAMTGRVEETRNAATRIGAQNLLNIIGNEPMVS